MKTKIAVPALVALTVFVLGSQAPQEHKDMQKTAPPDPTFEQFKKLAGDWVGNEVKGGQKVGQEVRANYKVMSNGSVVVETIMPTTEHEMATVIFKDGADLVLTHYCALGNQPHMKAKQSGDAKKIAFHFTGGTNIKSDKDMFMHGVTYTFLDNDTLKTEWVLFNDGKEAGTAVFEMKRKK